MKDKVKNIIVTIVAIFCISCLFWNIQSYYINKQLQSIEDEVERFVDKELERINKEVDIQLSKVNNEADNQLGKVDKELDRVESSITTIQSMVDELNKVANIFKRK